MDRQQVNFEIETLLGHAHGGFSDEFRWHRDVDDLTDFTDNVRTKSRHHSGPAELRLSLLDRARQLFSAIDTEDVEEDTEPVATVTGNREICGSSMGDLPTRYEAKGLLPHELPVIGTCVDPNIAVGFRYRVRRLGSMQFFYGGKALTLLSMGKGYGKRLTFESSDVLENDNYFWSDSLPEGYAFSVQAAEAGQSFDVYDDNSREVGKAVLEQVDAGHMGLSSEVLEDGTMVKKVQVVGQALLHYSADPHGLMSLHSEEALQISGIATLVRPPRSRKAVLKSIQVDHPDLGLCNFYPTEA